MNRLVNFRTRDTLETENQFEEFSFFSRLLRRSSGFSGASHQLITRLINVEGDRRMRTQRHSQLPTIAASVRRSTEIAEREKERDRKRSSFFTFSLSFSLYLSFLRYRSRVVRAITASEIKNTFTALNLLYEDNERESDSRRNQKERERWWEIVEVGKDTKREWEKRRSKECCTQRCWGEIAARE